MEPEGSFPHSQGAIDIGNLFLKALYVMFNWHDSV